jgi:carbon-monoxide dehydrogenase medium subunit
VLVGCRPEADVAAEVGRALDADLDPPSDVHASPALRRHLSRVLLGRVMTQIAA